MQNQGALDDLNQALDCDAFCKEALLLRSQVMSALHQSQSFTAWCSCKPAACSEWALRDWLLCHELDPCSQTIQEA